MGDVGEIVINSIVYVHNLHYLCSMMNRNTDDSLRLPAEWEEQSGVQLTWPHRQTDWRPYLAEITETYIALARAIVRHERLLVVTPEADAVRQLLTDRLGAEALGQITIAQCDTNDTWARDHGALTLMGEGGPQLLDFRFNGWGDKFAWQYDNAITAHLCAEGLLHGQRRDYDDMVLEGGSVESDGRGTIFTTSQCLLAPHRNQPLDRAGIERRLLQRLHAHRVVWIDHGQLAGDDTDGHIDTTVRVAPGNTLLYIRCTDASDSHYADLAAMERQLQQLTTTGGAPYRLVPLPMAQPIVYDGERLPATYANFLVINGAVIYPTYAQPANDIAAREAIAAAFPGRELIGIDSRVIIRQHGSIHCLTMQYPRGVLRA